MNMKIKITADIEGNWYEMTHSQEVDIEEWDIEGVACEALEVLAFKMKSALNPCFWDHLMKEHSMKSEITLDDGDK